MLVGWPPDLACLNSRKHRVPSSGIRAEGSTFCNSLGRPLVGSDAADQQRLTFPLRWGTSRTATGDFGRRRSRFSVVIPTEGWTIFPPRTEPPLLARVLLKDSGHFFLPAKSRRMLYGTVPLHGRSKPFIRDYQAIASCVWVKVRLNSMSRFPGFSRTIRHDSRSRPAHWRRCPAGIGREANHETARPSLTGEGAE